MPKEVVYAAESLYGDTEPAVGIVEVSWSREATHVQLATRSVRADNHEPYVWGDYEVILHQLEPEDADKVRWLMSGLYTTLDRTSINDLIRHLRRARDQAFGRDE
jgi:hypothetical protein